jgi:hypothetical protein
MNAVIIIGPFSCLCTILAEKSGRQFTWLGLFIQRVQHFEHVFHV